MRETQFIEQNKEKWKSFEEQLRSSKVNPEQLREQFVQVTDDLSYSRTFYKNRSVRVYLNSLGTTVYGKIYRNKTDFLKSVKSFFTYDVPLISYKSRYIYLLSFVLLIISVAIGMISSHKDPEFASSILGSGYISKTMENIKNGNPMGIYKDTPPFSMFLAIARNNLMVGFYFFIFGLIFSYGSIVLLVRNGIMLGTFMYFFYSRGLSLEFNFTVWMHGTIEIIGMIFECAAGVVLGRGLLFPGTLSRYKSFSLWARRGTMLYLGLVPFIIFAAFIESYLTRLTDISNVIRGLIIFGSFMLMVFYFVIYPLRKFHNKEPLETNEG
ncbi:MAG: stage II sporulation protein M, partial [Bacteroidia bacterium]|nr:stage II sporulation protein M [Bacteroidia bacterium]